MSAESLSYDGIAPVYHQRYAGNRLEGVADALASLVSRLNAKQILEVGCGTGRWLVELQPLVRRTYGLDLSTGMLRQAQQIHGPLALACGRATQLPFPRAAFDLVLCVNAIHHFGTPHIFVAEARRVLRPGGALAVINMDPHRGRDRWYVYNYFEGTREADLRRFPSAGTILDWMAAEGFERAEWQTAEHIVGESSGREVLDSHFLQKNGTSQLALLTDEAYAAGLQRIESALAEAETRGETITFATDVSLTMMTGFLPEASSR